MKTVHALLLKIVFFILLLYADYSFAQRSIPPLDSAIKENNCLYATPYTKPDTITFTFSGDPDYANYYFANLNEQLFKVFTSKGIPVSFTNGLSNDPAFALTLEKVKTIHENDGYDREMRYELLGILQPKEAIEPVLSFKITVNTIHDINQQNKKVAEYLLGKIQRLKD